MIGLAASEGSGAPQETPLRAAATIILPMQVVAGEPATLAVLDADGQLVPGASVEVSGIGQMKTDATGRIAFTVPSGITSLSVKAENEIAADAAVVPPAGPVPGSPSSGRIVGAPSVIAVEEPFEISGIGFKGDASQDHLSIAERPALVLAASPVSLVVLPGPGAIPGDTKLTLSVQGQQTLSRPVTLVSLSVAGPANPFSTGETSSLVVRVTGSAKPVLVQVTNSTPEVIDLPGGNLRRLATSGGPSNAATLPVASVRPGEYAVSVRLLAISPGAPGRETARLELVNVRGIADAKWQRHIDDLLALLKRNPADLPRVRQEISKQLREHPPARIEDSLRVVGELLAAG